MYMFPKFPKCFRFQMMKAEKRKASKKEKKKPCTKFDSREETMLTGLNHESVQCYIVLIFFFQED